MREALSINIFTQRIFVGSFNSLLYFRELSKGKLFGRPEE